jgi:hypothetical protein
MARSSFADVVPARKAKTDRDAAAVERRMADLGVDSSSARAGADRLTPSELRYFAEDPTRLQSIGGLTAGEWLAGGAFLALLAFIYFAFISNQ